MPGVTIILDEATPLLESVGKNSAVAGLILVGTRAVASQVKEHLYGLDAQRHNGGNHFYRQAGDSVSTGISPQGGVVSINHTGFRQRLKGGAIYPAKHYLTIPASPEAIGKRAREFNDLDFAYVFDPKFGFLRPALVRRAQTVIKITRRKQKDGSVSFSAKPVRELAPEVMFWLVRDVGQKADPTVLPYDEQMAATAIGAIKTRILRLKTGGGTVDPSAN